VLDELGIDKLKMVGVCSDGASVFTGQINGVADQLKRLIPHLTSVHCVAHKCALMMSKSNYLPTLVLLDKILKGVHNLFDAGGHVDHLVGRFPPNSFWSAFGCLILSRTVLAYCAHSLNSRHPKGARSFSFLFSFWQPRGTKCVFSGMPMPTLRRGWCGCYGPALRRGW
jgi:hypothetical protein